MRLSLLRVRSARNSSAKTRHPRDVKTEVVFAEPGGRFRRRRAVAEQRRRHEGERRARRRGLHEEEARAQGVLGQPVSVGVPAAGRQSRRFGRLGQGAAGAGGRHYGFGG